MSVDVQVYLYKLLVGQYAVEFLEDLANGVSYVLINYWKIFTVLFNHDLFTH